MGLLSITIVHTKAQINIMRAASTKVSTVGSASLKLKNQEDSNLHSVNTRNTTRVFVLMF